MLIGHLWHLKTVVFLHWCLLCAVLLGLNATNMNVQFKTDYWVLRESIYAQNVYSVSEINGANLNKKYGIEWGSITESCLNKNWHLVQIV